MRVFIKIYKFILRIIRRLLILPIRKYGMLYGASLACGKISCRTKEFNVPVSTRCTRGSIKIDSGVSLGFRGAPKVGSGEILIQAREPLSEIVIAGPSAFSNNISIVARTSIQIGKRFLCGDGVRIMDSDFHEVNPEKRIEGGSGLSGPIVIGENVWLGSGVIVLKGVTIGDHSIIAPGSVVTRSIPERVVAGGVPARVIKSI